MDDNVQQGSFIGTFLDSPIISSDRDAFLVMLRTSQPGQPTPALPAMRKAQYLTRLIGTSDVIALEPESYQWFLDSLRPTSTADLLLKATGCVNTLIGAVRRSSWDWAQLVGGGLPPMGDPSPDAVRWHSCMMQLNAIVSAVAISRAKGVRSTVDTTSSNLRYVGDQYYGCLSFDGNGEWLLVTYSQLLMIKDMAYMRFNSYVACDTVYSQRPRTREALSFVIAWEMKCLGYYGNAGYELLKSIESLAKCNLTRMADKYLAEEGSYQSMKNKICEKESKLSGQDHPLVDELCLFLESLTDLAVAVEVFGFQKLSGHPLVDPVMAGRSVREEAAKKIDYSPSDCLRLRNNCCRIYTEGYVKKNGRWPPLVFPASSRLTRLYQLYSINELSISVGSYPISDWEGVRFAAHLTFEGFENYLDLIDDKSVSLYRDDCRATWDRRVKPHSSKRLLLELLSRPGFSVMGIVDRVRRGDIPASWLIVSLYPKERELKIAARLFSMMVIEMRVFFASCEANLAEFVYPCLQPQTMTLRKQEVKELFITLTREYTEEDLVRLFLEVDLSRWNLRWHPEVVDPVGDDLNDMFGLPGVFTTIHHFFKKCLILIRVPSCPPEGIEQDPIPESDLCFYNHEVGFEGIAQKLWSFLTFGMIDLAMVDHEGPYYLVGQGDNQVLLMTVSVEGAVDKKALIRVLSSELAERIEYECSIVGQEAKPEECLQSTSVVTYSKNVYIRGVEYHTVIKACSRIFPSASSDFPSLNGSVGAISASCTAAAEVMDNPLDAFRLMVFHTSVYLLSQPLHAWVEACYLPKPIKEALTEPVVMRLLILPNDLGGCLVAPITSFLYKGGGDTLSKSVASLKFYQGGSRPVRRMISALEKRRWVDPHVTADALLEDPYGIPLRRPQGSEQSVKSESLDCIRSISRNTDLSQILSENTGEFESALKEALYSCRPFNPVLLSDILGFSVVGVKATLQNMFTSTGTVQTLLHSSGAFDFSLCVRVLGAGANLFQTVVSRLTHLPQEEGVVTSIYSFTSDLRRAWKHEGVELPMVGVTTYIPFDFPIVVTSAMSRSSSFKTLMQGEGFDHDIKSSGRWASYDGLDTKEKRSEYGYKIVTSTTAATAVSRLMSIATQPNVSPGFIDLVAVAAATRSSVDSRRLLPLLSRAIGGSIAHRYTAVFGSRGAYGLNTTTWSTHCLPHTDDAPPFSASTTDYPLMVQEMMVAGIAAARLVSISGKSNAVIELRTDSQEFIPLPEEALTVRPGLTLNPPQYITNRLVFDNDLRLRKITGTVECDLIKDVTDTIEASDLILEAVRARVRQGYLTNNVALRIIDSSARFASFKLDVLETARIGVRRICDMFAVEIAAVAGNQTMSITNAGVRWTPVPAIVSLSTAAAASVGKMVTHPSVREDPFIRDLAPLSLFQYTFSGVSVEKRLQSYMASAAIKMLLTPGSRLYKSPEILFPDDGANNTVYLISRRLKLILLQSVLLGELPPASVRVLTRMVALQPITGAAEDDIKAEKLSVASSVLLEWAETRELRALASQVRALVSGRLVQRHKRSSQEIIRLARAARLDRVPRVVTTTVLSEQVFPRFGMLDLSGVTVIAEEWRRPFRQMCNLDDFEETNKRLFGVQRLRGRLFGAESNAGYSYSGIAHLTRGRITLVIGCGHGGGAAVLLAAGCTHVIGLDYYDDLDPVEVIRGNLVPPSIYRSGLSHLFTRVDVNLEETGNIFHSRTAQLLRRYSGEGTLIVVDIRIQNEAEYLSLFSTLRSFLSAADVLLRFIGSLATFDVVVATLTASKILTEVRHVFHSCGHCEVWMVIRYSEASHMCGGHLDGEVRWPPVTPDYPDLSFLGGGHDYLEQMVMGPYYGLPSDEIFSNAVILDHALEASIGGTDHRFSYQQFTDVLHAYAYREAITADDPWSVVENFAKTGVMSVELRGRRVTLDKSPRLSAMILVIMPRMFPKGVLTHE